MAQRLIKPSRAQSPSGYDELIAKTPPVTSWAPVVPEKRDKSFSELEKRLRTERVGWNDLSIEIYAKFEILTTSDVTHHGFDGSGGPTTPFPPKYPRTVS